MKHWSLRARFLLALIVLMVGIFIAITSLIVEQDRKTLRNNLITQSKSFSALATQPIGNTFVIYKDSGTLKIDQEVGSFTELDGDISSVAIIDANGTVLFTNKSNASPHINSDIAASITTTYEHDKAGNLTTIIQPYTESFGIHRYDVVYGVSYQSVNQTIQNIVTLILELSAAILIISLILWYLMINQLFLRPVAKISQVALLISKGDLETKNHLSRSDEIGDLATAVDTMASSLKDDITKLKKSDELKSEFLMITSHNLRTPLAIIDGYVEIIQDALKKPTKNLDEEFSILSANVKRLKHFSEDALTISSMEVGQSHVSLEAIEIAPVLKDIASEFELISKQKRLQFNAVIDTHDLIKINRGYFHSALWNLFDNAYKFTTAGGSISVQAYSKEDQVIIEVSDTGIGISAQELPQLFTKFHRGTDTLEYDYEGTGIGLYLTRLIMEQHGGKVSVISQKGKGSTFTLYFPVYIDRSLNKIND